MKGAISAMDTLAQMLVAFALSSFVAVQACTDSETISYQAYRADGQGLIYYDCPDLVATWPYYCRPEVVIQESHPADACCASCRGTDTSCVDMPAVYSYKGSSYATCPGFIAQFPEVCDPEHIHNQQLGKACCKSCRDAAGSGNVPAYSTCNDDESFKHRIWGKTYTGCSELLAVHPYYCVIEDYNKEGGVCCESCQNIDTSCVTEPGASFNYAGNTKKTYNCVGWVGQDECHCLLDTVKTTCCSTCNANDPTAMAALEERCRCRNLLNWRNKVTVGSTEFTSCKRLIKKFPQVCAQNAISGDNGACCKQCIGVDPYCIDTRDYKIFYNDKKGKVACYGIPKKYRQSYCCDNQEYKSNCCSFCKKQRDAGQITDCP